MQLLYVYVKLKMGSSKNYKNLTNVLNLLVVITLPCLLDFCEASQCHTCHDGGIPIAPDDYSPSCKENNNDISQSCGDEVDQCAQFKAFENGKTVVLSKGCNWPRSCLEQTFRVGKEVGCKTIQGKEYNEKCPGRPSLRKFRNGTGTGPEKPGEIVEIKNEWTVEWCV